MRRLHRALGTVLSAAEGAAIEDLPRLHIRSTMTDEHVEKAVRLAVSLHSATKEAHDSLRGAHTEASLAFYAELALEREEKRMSDETALKEATR